MSRRNGVRMSSLLITLLLCAVPAWTQVVHQFGKRGVDPCQRQSFQSKCVQDNGSTERSQFVLRYYRKGDECVSYPYGRCPGDDVESSLFRYKEACISYCVNRKGLLSTLASKETKDDDAVELFPPKEFELAALRLSDDSGTCMKPKDRGPCDKYELRFYYNKQAKRCKYFFYGGCNGNDNNFEKLVDCQQTCETQGENTTFASAPVPLREQDTTQSRSLDATTVSSGAAPVNLCDHQTDTGTCGGAFQRCHHWFRSYKADSNECEQFIYTGCGGNGNNFATKQECQTACVVLPPNICDHPRDSGPCSGSFTRFFYDNDQNKCVEFNYGGCEGNGNNFPNIDTCETQCDQKVEGDFFPARNPVVATETRCPPVDCQALHINCISVTRQDGCHTCACPEGIPGLTPATPPLIGATPRFTPALAETTETPTEGPPGAPGLQPPPDFFREQSIEVNRRNSSESFGTSAAPRCRVVDCQPTCIRVQQPNGCDECLCSTAATPEATDQSSIPTSSGCPTISESDCPVPQCIKFRDNRNCVKCACPLESPTSGPSDPQPLNVVEQQQPTQVAPTPTTPTRTPAARLPPSEVPAPSLSRQNVCFLDKDAGPCRDWVVRYFYNGQSRRCEPFQYGGCSGNQNHFYNEQQCVDHCERLTPDSQRPPLARQPIQPTLSPVVQQQPFVPSPPPQFGGQQFGGPPQQFGGPPPQFGGPPQQFGGPPQQFGGPPPQFGGPPPPVGGPPGFNPGPTDGRPGGRRRPTSSVDGSFCAEMNLSICQPPCLIRTLLDGCQECMCNGPNPNRGRNNNQGPNSRVFGDRGFEDQGRNVFPDYEFIDDFGSPVNTNIRRTEPFHGGNDIGVVPSGYQPPRFEPFGGPIGSGIVVPPPSFSQPQNSFERVGTAGRVIPFPNAPVDVGFAGPASIYGPPRRSGFHRSAVIEGDPDTISTGLTVNASEFLNGNHDSKLRRHPARLPSANDNKQVCALPMQRGTCEGSHLRWYYDAVSSMCRLFYYSGCEGNDNNFESKNRCQSACSSMATSEDRTLRLCPGNTEPLGSPVPVPCGPGAVACPTGYYCSVNHLCCENNGGSDASAVAFSFEPLKLVAASAEDAFQASRRNNPVISGFCNKPETTASNCESDSFNSGRQIFYYFDVISNACHPYFYKGCAGNFSGLTSKDDCEKICKS